MLICPSEVGKTPVGMPVGWSLPACLATSPAISQRERLEIEHEDLRFEQ